MKSRKRKPSHRTSRKKPYHAPSLATHGDLRRLTQLKAGMMGDGAGVPKTRMAVSAGG